MGDEMVAEEKRLTGELGANKANAKRRVNLTKKLEEAQRLEEAERKDMLMALRRNDVYGGLEGKGLICIGSCSTRCRGD